MSAVDQSMLSSEERPVGLRTRPDLEISESAFQGEICWIVKDPVALKYFRLRKPEYLVLKMLESPTSYHDLKVMLTRMFPDATTRIESVQQLVISLHRNCLMISEAVGQSKPLQKRRDKEITQKLISLCSRFIAIRFPGIDPERILQWMYPKVSWFFTPWFCVFAFALVISALTLVCSNLDTFFAKLPEFQRFFAFNNIIFMGTILMVTKTLHEFGHGLMCKHFGGECHQIGFMLLALMPAMYCDTSDSWTMPNRWHRIAIGAGGMYVEVLLSAIATFVWWYTNPGMLHFLALNIMFLSSVSTLIFNLNPLLRYDGYYMLSDLLEIPNLSQKAKLSMTSKIRQLCLGMEPVKASQLPQRHQTIFAIYGVMSIVYRTLVIVFIFWFMGKIFEPLGLAPIGHLILGSCMITIVAMPAYKMGKYFLSPGRFRKMKKIRLYSTLAFLTLLAAFICFVPIPHYVWAEFVVRPQDPHMVITKHSGTLKQVNVTNGSRVEAGEIIGILENDQLLLELEQLNGQLARLENQLAELQLSSSLRFDPVSRIVETNMQIESTRKQIKLKQLLCDELSIRSERAGIVFAPENRLASKSADPELPSWSDTPLDEKNQGIYLEANTLIGIIGEPMEMEAILIVAQSDIKLLNPGQTVLALSQQFPHVFVSSELTSVSQNELAAIPRELSNSNGGPIPVEPNPLGGERPVLTSYEAFASFSKDELIEKNVELLPGMRGNARIHVGSATLAERGKRLLSSLMKF